MTNKPKLKRKKIKRIQLKSKGNNRTDFFHYLLFYRNNEKITRVDRFSIVMYWEEFDKIIHQILFYPSKFGMNQIYMMKEEDTPQGKLLFKQLQQLQKYGNPLWNKEVDEKITPQTWRNLHEAV